MEVKDLKQLIKMITETDITEFEMDNAEEKIVIKRGQRTEIMQMAAPAQNYLAPAPMMAAPASVSAPAAPAPAAVPAASEAGETINSPIVGTFYRAASPGADPFVKEGDAVKKGQTIGIIEAMKLLNEIESDATGVVKAILVENGQPVEYGQPLFVIG